MGLDYTFLILILFQITNIVLYSQFTDYGTEVVATNDSVSNTISNYYPFFQDVHVMIFIGFGFLMTFLRGFSFSSVGFNFLLACLSIQSSILINGFFHCLFSDHWSTITLDIKSLITGDFAAGAVLIAFGAVLGKLAIGELILMSQLLLVAYAVNESIGVIKYGAVDMGGSMYVHTFGAFFGVAVSYITTNKQTLKSSHFRSTKNNDLFAMIGTLFLWIYWPSFNGALATGNAQHRVVINTVLALTNSCVGAFIGSYWLNKGRKISMVDIQNATLAGGVAVGSSADLVISPYGSLIVGLVAGLYSTFGYNCIGPFLERRGLHDTCGVLNLHGMPGIIGGLGGAISAASASNNLYGGNLSEIFPEIGKGRTIREQSYYQLAALGTTLAISVSSGLLTGLIIRAFNRNSIETYSDDTIEWLVEEDDEDNNDKPYSLAETDRRVGEL